MAVIKYNLLNDRNRKLSANFTVREFACKDGNVAVLVDDKLVEGLQKIRDHFGKPIHINSAYRTIAHNKAVGGSPNSQHLQGKAADIVIAGVSPLKVAQYAEAIGMGGIGLYDGFTHVDSRDNKSKWDYRGNGKKAVGSFGGQEQLTIVSKPNYYDKVKQRFGLDDDTMAYLGAYKYGDALLSKLANGK